MEVSVCFRKILDQVTIRRDIHFTDQLIAATAIAHNVPLLTLNTEHFRDIDGLTLA